MVDIQDSSNYAMLTTIILYVKSMFHILYSQNTSITHHLRSECRRVVSDAYKVLLMHRDVFEVPFGIK